MCFKIPFVFSKDFSQLSRFYLLLKTFFQCDAYDIKCILKKYSITLIIFLKNQSIYQSINLFFLRKEQAQGTTARTSFS